MKRSFVLLTGVLCFSVSMLYSQQCVLLGAEEIKLILRAHNTERRLVGSPDLVWDESLAKYANEWAIMLARGNTGIRHRSQSEQIYTYGENIAYFMGYSFTANRGVDMWNEERADYTYSKIGSLQNISVGHYTQVVWGNTKSVGCGCAKSSTGAYFFVCNYNPAGNYIGEYPYSEKYANPSVLIAAPIVIKEKSEIKNDLIYDNKDSQPFHDETQNLNRKVNSANLVIQNRESQLNTKKTEPDQFNKQVLVSSKGNQTIQNESLLAKNGSRGIKKMKSKKIKTGNSQVFTFKFGGQLNYIMGNVPALSSSFDSRILSGSGMVMLGYRFGNSRKKSAFGVFSTFGQYSPVAANYFYPVVDPYHSVFYEVEGGFIIHEWLRLSGGRGVFKLGTAGVKNDFYTNATLGFAFGSKNFKFEVNNTMMFLQTNNRIIWKPSFGLCVKLDFWKR